eukprot:scaffold13626_cov110-Isochrysis_galbana.AAC.3
MPLEGAQQCEPGGSERCGGGGPSRATAGVDRATLAPGWHALLRADRLAPAPPETCGPPPPPPPPPLSRDRTGDQIWALAASEAAPAARDRPSAREDRRALCLLRVAHPAGARGRQQRQRSRSATVRGGGATRAGWRVRRPVPGHELGRNLNEVQVGGQPTVEQRVRAQPLKEARQPPVCLPQRQASMRGDRRASSR